MKKEYLYKDFNILNLGLTEIDLRNFDKVLGTIDVGKKIIFKKIIFLSAVTFFRRYIIILN